MVMAMGTVVPIQHGRLIHKDSATLSMTNRVNGMTRMGINSATIAVMVLGNPTVVQRLLETRLATAGAARTVMEMARAMHSQKLAGWLIQLD
jgi:hypothetical protein